MVFLLYHRRWSLGNCQSSVTMLVKHVFESYTRVTVLWTWRFVDRKVRDTSLLFGEYAISQLRFVRLGLQLVTYLDVGNFSNKSTETTLHEICVQVFLRFSDSSKPSQSVSLIYEFAWLTGFRKSEENLPTYLDDIMMTSRQLKTIGRCVWTLMRH